MTDQATVRVLIVDDQAPFRNVARTVVTIAPGFEVAGEAETGEAAVECVAELTPDLVLMDINMPGINGIEATRRITATHPETKTFLLSTYSESDLPGGARDCGASAYINKENFDPAVLRRLWDDGGDPAWTGYVTPRGARAQAGCGLPRAPAAPRSHWRAAAPPGR